MNHTSSNPSSALANPTSRKTASGVSSTAVTARLAASGNAAQTTPSMTKTSPSATKKSDMDSDLELDSDLDLRLAPTRRGPPNSTRCCRRRGRQCGRLCSRRRGRRGRAGSAALLAARIREVAEEFRIGPDDQPRVALPQTGLIGLHRAVEAEECGIPAVGLREDAVALGVALAARLLGLGGRIGHQHGDVAVGAGTDFLRLLGALRAEFLRFALALRLHALVDRLAVLLRQIGAPDAHVDHRDAELLGLAVELLAHARHELRALVAHQLGERGLAEHAPQGRVEQGRKPRVCALDRADGLVEAQRVMDAIAGEGIDHEPLLIGRDHLLGRILEIENALA